MLTEPQFKVLLACLSDCSHSQRYLNAETEISLGAINSIVTDLRKDGFIDEQNIITSVGKDELEQYKVQNAVIMAAGLSSRFAPISYEKPKGLLLVKGEIIIERQIRQLKEAGIDDITVVVGYKKEEFFYLEELFGVKIVINADYAKRNNNSTIKCVEDRLGNTYICSSDDYFMTNPFEQYVYSSYYSSVFMEGETEEYCLRFKGKRKVITDVTIGGNDAWAMLGHVYWNKEFSREFLKVLNEIYDDPTTYGKLWEDIYSDNINRLPQMVIRQYEPGIIWEFDSLNELRDFDSEFINNVDSKIMDNICKVLNCNRVDIRNVAPISQGLTNLSCRFEVNGSLYVYRHPGNGTDEIINRKSETFSQGVARNLGLDDTFIYEDEKTGWKISKFIEDCKEFDYHNQAHVDKAMMLIRTLHDSGIKSDFEFNLIDNIESTIDLLRKNKKLSIRDFDELHDLAKQAAKILGETSDKKVLCHNDFYAPNLLVDGDDIQLIDWEYSGMADYASDLGTFICCSEEYTYEDSLSVLEKYFGRKLMRDELRHCIAAIVLASFYWYVWALYKDANDEPVGEWIYIWYKKTKEYGARLLTEE